jgi:hypothetical protein
VTGWITRYDRMPIPPVPEHTECVDAGAVSIGVEYRLLTDAIAAASEVQGAAGTDAARAGLDDRGVSLHVFAELGGERLEVLRFDCFQEDPPTTGSAESPRFTGRAVAALAADPHVLARSGRAFAARELALEYGFRDVDGRLPAGPLHGRPRASA